MFPGSRARPVHRADNLAAICEPIVLTIWNPQHLTTLLASTACYVDCFTLLYFLFVYASTPHKDPCGHGGTITL
jgi:hypothetical protein